MSAAERARSWLEAVNALWDLGVDASVLVLLLGALLSGLTIWVGWRRPAFAFLPALASLAIRPELLWGNYAIRYEWGLHQTLLIVALLVNAWHFGFRKSINWPIAALIMVFGLNLMFGDLHDDLTAGLMLTGLLLLALPFTFTQVILAAESRRVCTLAIVIAPLLSVAAGAVLQAAGIHTMFGSVHDRLEGATGNSAIFGMLAFAGFAIALHESTAGSRSRPYVLALAGINLALVILSGTRMSILASAVLMLAYLLASAQFRERLQHSRVLTVFGMGLIGAALALYSPTLYRRIFEDVGRWEIWERFYQEFWRSPIFGRGIGSGFIAWTEPLFSAPHNEYLHLLSIGGIVGFALCMAGIVLWYWNLIRAAWPRDREFLLALAPALAIYAITDNVLVYPTGLAVFVYLGVIRQASDSKSPARAAEDAAQGHRASEATRPEVKTVQMRP